jgi:cytochrome c peroxidase
MHDGSLPTLEAVVDFYNQGGRPNRNLFPVIRPLGLTAEDKQALVKFLESLSGTVTR